MNYKVTFYKDEMEMLTERNANFVNKLKALTSQVVTKLAKKMAAEMGRKAKNLALTKFNDEICAAEVAEIIKGLKRTKK